MRLCSSKACVIVLTESNTWIRINNNEPFLLPANHLILMAAEGNHIEFSTLNRTFIAHVDRQIIKAYLRFIDKTLTGISLSSRLAPPFITRPCRTPDIFKQAAAHSMMQTNDPCEIERTRSLLFTVISIFLDDVHLLPLLINMLPPNTCERVRTIINSDIKKEWYLDSVAKCLFMSSSLLKKKLKKEQTSYSQIVTECRMQLATEQLRSQTKNINTISQNCGYHSPSHFISVFKSFYGMTPLHYANQLRQENTIHTPERL